MKGLLARLALIAIIVFIARCDKCDPHFESCGARPIPGEGPGPGNGPGTGTGAAPKVTPGSLGTPAPGSPSGGRFTPEAAAGLAGTWYASTCLPTGFGQFQRNVVTFSADAMTEYRFDTHTVAGCTDAGIPGPGYPSLPRYQIGGNAPQPAGAVLINFIEQDAGLLPTLPFGRFNVLRLEAPGTIVFGATGGGAGMTEATRPTTLDTTRYFRR